MKKKIVAVAFAVALASTAFAYSKMKADERKCPYDNTFKCSLFGW